MIWRQRLFPEANLLFLGGSTPTLVDSGFVGHAAETASWVGEWARRLELVVNTHWHSDHVGGNGILQQRGAAVAAAGIDADGINRPRCAGAAACARTARQRRAHHGPL